MCVYKDFFLPHRSLTRVREEFTLTIPKSLLKLVKFYSGAMTQALSSLRNERSGRKSRPQSEIKKSYRTRAKWTTGRMVGMCDGNAVVTCVTCTIGQKFDGPSSPFETLVEYIPITQVKSTSVWKENADRKNLGLCVLRAGRGWSRDLMKAS